MDTIRNIKMIIKGKETVDGAGVKLSRMFSYKLAKLFDPFLLFDAFGSENPEEYLPGFPWHPHRGIETVTYMLSGSVEHKDSLGNTGVLSQGDCQWMTAGRGIIHQEMPVKSELLAGIQIWVNLPKEHKMIKPAYRDIKKEQITETEIEGSFVKLIAGNYKGRIGPAEGIMANPTFMEVKVPFNVKFEFEASHEDQVFVFIISGKGSFHPDSTETPDENSVVLFEQGDLVQIVSRSEQLHFLLFSGKPLREEITWRGPIVMNSEDELDEALAQLEDGTFTK